MKSPNRLLLGIGLLLVPALVLAAPAPVASVVPGLVVDEGSAWSPPSQDVCSETTPAAVGMEVEAPQDCGIDGAQGVDGALGDAAAPVSMERKPCKACPLQPWCACTYQGYPRISCDPCCYSTGFGQICTS